MSGFRSLMQALSAQCLATRQAVEPPHMVDLDGRAVEVRLRPSAAARQLSMRLDPRDGAVLLTLPKGSTPAQGLAFVCSKADWLRARLAALPPRHLFAPGQRLPLLGVEHRLEHRPEARGGVWAEAGVIHVSGQADFFARRVTDWLKRQARNEITRLAEPMAAALAHSAGARPLRGIAIKDTQTRWGSCSSRGDLAFSWRLVLAPPEVLQYVVAHEVAHLAEMNHSPRFWRLVRKLSPEAPALRAWLKRHGAELHRYG